MVILHFAHVRNERFSGVAVVVPQHVRAQAEFAQVGFVNVAGNVVPGIENQLPYDARALISDLPVPFNRPDLIVFHEVYRPAFLKLYKQAKKAKIPYIIVPHGCLTKGAQKKKALKKLAGNILLFNRFVRSAVAVQFLSEVEKETSPFGTRKFIGTNGVPMPVKRKEKFGHDKVQFAYIGRLDMYHKGLDILSEAVGFVASDLRAKQCAFDIYGPEDQGRCDELQKTIQQNEIEGLVTLYGPAYEQEKENVLLNSDIFIQTSRFEGMPLGILEALSYGIPCLVTRGTNLGEIIEEYGAGWVAETNAKSVAEAILRALNERENWAEMSQNAIRLIEENFQWKKVAEAAVVEYQHHIRN